jgi:hypothetical protein
MRLRAILVFTIICISNIKKKNNKEKTMVYSSPETIFKKAKLDRQVASQKLNYSAIINRSLLGLLLYLRNDAAYELIKKARCSFIFFSYNDLRNC